VDLKNQLISAVARKVVGSGTFMENAHGRACVKKPRLSFEQQQHEERIAFPPQASKRELARKDQQYFHATAAVQLFLLGRSRSGRHHSSPATINQASFLYPAASAYLLLHVVATQGSP